MKAGPPPLHQMCQLHHPLYVKIVKVLKYIQIFFSNFLGWNVLLLLWCSLFSSTQYSGSNSGLANIQFLHLSFLTHLLCIIFLPDHCTFASSFSLNITKLPHLSSGFIALLPHLSFFMTPLPHLSYFMTPSPHLSSLIAPLPHLTSLIAPLPNLNLPSLHHCLIFIFPHCTIASS